MVEPPERIIFVRAAEVLSQDMYSRGSLENSSFVSLLSGPPSNRLLIAATNDGRYVDIETYGKSEFRQIVEFEAARRIVEQPRNRHARRKAWAQSRRKT